jgi:hypothetical protein
VAGADGAGEAVSDPSQPNVHRSGLAEPDTMRESPLWDGPGHHPDLTKTETGCHVWRGSRYGACWKHGTVGCCLIAHASPAARRAYDQPRCEGCGRFLPGQWFDHTLLRCEGCRR